MNTRTIQKYVLLKSILIIILIVMGKIIFTSDDPNLIVNTSSGKIGGFTEISSDGRSYYVFLSIPFAKPPLGNLRFKNPEKYGRWKEGLKNGSIMSSVCPQPDLGLYLNNLTTSYLGNEDCLYLSVYTPKISEKKLPVLFFIHGGAFVSGSANSYSGYDFMTEEVVLVISNYRIGVLGFLSTEDDVIPGNLGLKDQTMALEWVQDNIENFGGDPNKVTIFGESAGAASVHFHVLYPISKGLFTRAIMQSGTALCPWTHSKGQRAIAHQVGAHVGCFTPAETGTRQSKRLLECLKKVDAKSLTMSFSKFMNFTFLPLNFNPFVDGTFITDEPEVILKNGDQNEVDLIIGINKDEGAFLSKSVIYESDFLEKIQRKFDYYSSVSLGLSNENKSEEISRKVYEYYGGINYIAESQVQLAEMLGHRQFMICSDSAAFLHSQNNKRKESKIYFYEFDYRGQFSYLQDDGANFGDHWVSHGDELLYMFFNPNNKEQAKRNDDDNKVSAIFTKLWVNFANSGNPTIDDSLGFVWRAFSKEYPKHLSITLTPEMKDYQRTEAYQFWSSLPTHENELLRKPNEKQTP